jgi:hypothetical protein
MLNTKAIAAKNIPNTDFNKFLITISPQYFCFDAETIAQKKDPGLCGIAPKTSNKKALQRQGFLRWQLYSAKES